MQQKSDLMTIRKDEGTRITIISLLDRKKLCLQKSGLLGKGSFGSVYSLKNNEMETNLACKEINLQHPKMNGFFAHSKYKRNYRFFKALQEIYELYTRQLHVYKVSLNVLSASFLHI